MAATDLAGKRSAGDLGGDAWFLLPPVLLSDGGLARRLSRVLDPKSLLSIVMSATGPLVGISFELVEHGSSRALSADPHLGRVLVDGRTLCFGLVEMSRASMTFTALSVRAESGIVTALANGRTLEFATGCERVIVSLLGAGELLRSALRSICDPAHVPVEAWLSGNS